MYAWGVKTSKHDMIEALGDNFKSSNLQSFKLLRDNHQPLPLYARLKRLADFAQLPSTHSSCRFVYQRTGQYSRSSGRPPTRMADRSLREHLRPLQRANRSSPELIYRIDLI